MTIKSKDMTDINDVIREINDFLRTPSERTCYFFTCQIYRKKCKTSYQR